MTHVAAIQQFLQGCSGDMADKARGMQLGSLTALFKSTPVTITQATELHVMLGSMGWSETDMSSMTSVLLDSSMGAPSSSSSSAVVMTNARRQLQDYTHFAHYLQESDWVIMADIAVAPARKMDHLLQHAINLGMVCPSEASVQVISAMYLMMCEDAAMAAAMRLETLKAVKSQHKRLAARSNVEGVWVQQLPIDPAMFKQTYPTWWLAAFGEHGSVVASRLLHSELQSVVVSIPMRSSRSDSRVDTYNAQPMMVARAQLQYAQPHDMHGHLMHTPHRHQQPHIVQHGAQMGGQMEAFAQSMMQSMTNMTNMQQLTLQFLTKAMEQPAVKAVAADVPAMVRLPPQPARPTQLALGDVAVPDTPRAPVVVDAANVADKVPAGKKPRLSVMEATSHVMETISTASSSAKASARTVPTKPPKQTDKPKAKKD